MTNVIVTAKRLRAMKDACAILHQVQQSNGGNVMYYGDIDTLVSTVEDVFEDMKRSQP